MKHITHCLIQFKNRVIKTSALTALLLLLFSFNASSQVFWTEAFQNACSSGCVASTYTGPNGTWVLNP
ncbi:MAG: hypothetical protein ACXVPU_18965, partial [Bacteroidia bacterium]